MSNATYKGKSYGRGCDRGTTYLFYEYREHEYTVEDRHWIPAASDMTLAMQHRREQAKIDRLIEEMDKPQKPYRYEDTADCALQKYFDYVEGDEHAFDD